MTILISSQVGHLDQVGAAHALIRVHSRGMCESRAYSVVSPSPGEAQSHAGRMPSHEDPLHREGDSTVQALPVAVTSVYFRDGGAKTKHCST